MRFFGHLIKGEITTPEKGQTRNFPNMNKTIGDPRILFAMALEGQSSVRRFAARYFSGRLPEKIPEIRMLKDYIRVHGYPKASKEEIDETHFAEYAVGGVKETILASEEAARIRHLMHRELHEKGKGLTLEERMKSILTLHDIMWKHYDTFKAIAIAEGTPVKLFDWQTTKVFNTLCQEKADFIADMLGPKEIACSVEGERTFLTRYPFGAVGIFPPYNAALGLGFTAILSSYYAGNASVTRTPTRMPLTNMELAYVLHDAMETVEFPRSAFQAVIGPSRPIAQYMVNEGPLNAMVYYGDSQIGLDLMAQAIKRGMHFVPELAGSGASLVWKDIDIKKTAAFVSRARFFGSGQICLAAKRLFLHEAIYDEFIEELVQESEALKVGFPADPETDLPIMGSRALYQIIDMTDEALKKGAKLECGGYRINVYGDRDEAGFFYKPTVLRDVPLDCQMWYQETFGPVLPIMKVRNFDQAIAQANNTPYGIRTSVYSEDPDIWQRFFDEIEAPGVAINTDHLHFDTFYPHLGGLKTSGIFGGKYFYEALTYLKYRHFPA
jgi:acyl-CoA reductase-like NAD-dependent aldehyde dehydrogenase